MSQAYISPADFVQWVTVEGIHTEGGNVRLTRYMSGNEKMGGSYTSQELREQLKPLFKKLGDEPSWTNWHRIFTGQGDLRDFIALWDWMYRHMDELRKLKVQTYTVKKKPAGEGYDKIMGKKLDFAEVFKAGRAFSESMDELISNGCFGWDCIGFVSQYLVTIGQIDQYQQWRSDQYLTIGGFKPIKNLLDITECCVLVFGDWHIVLVSEVQWKVKNARTGVLSAKVVVSQSYTGGPKTRKDCILTQAVGEDGTWDLVNQTGVLDVGAKWTVGRHQDIQVMYQMPFAP